MRNYKMHSIALTPDEERRFQKIKKEYGIKKIFRTMLDVLSPVETPEHIKSDETATIEEI